MEDGIVNDGAAPCNRRRGQGDSGQRMESDVGDLIDQSSDDQQGVEEQDEQQDQPGLLDQEADRDDEGDEPDGQGQQQQPQAGLSAEDVARIVESALDRRINAVLKDRRRQTTQTPAQPSRPTGPSESDVREARSVFREYVGDEIRFLGNAERDLASQIAGGMIRDRLAQGGVDPEHVGAEVARDVAKQVKALRKHYEDRTVAALRRSGQITATAPGQPLKGPTTPNAESGFKAGAAKAAELFADRMPKQQ